MLRRLSLKAWIGIGVGVVAIIVAVIAIVVIKKKPEAYRTIKVYDLVGNAQVVRGDGKVIDVYNSMRLESEDRVSTDKESYLQLKLDDNKYILLEPETEILIKATGTKRDSKTQIYLEKGAIVNCLEDELSDSSEYKIETPNSTIAVRGTTFRVELRTDEKEETYTMVSAYEGKVVSNLVYPDGTVEDKKVEITGGHGVKIHGTDVISEYVVVDESVKYEELNLEVLEFLKKPIENNKDISISEEELQDLIDSIKGDDGPIEEPTTEAPTVEEPTTEVPTIEKPTAEEPTTEAPTIEEPTAEELITEAPTTEAPTTEAPTIEAPTTEAPTTEAPTTEVPTTEAPTTEEPTPEEPTTEEPTTEEPTTVEPKYYVVTFKYGDKVFVTQQVKEGTAATRPKMKPAKTGDWDYDFITAVTNDLVVNWVQ